MLKSDTIVKKDIPKEISRAWKFNPYRIHYDGPSIDRHTSRIEYECLNCNHKMKRTFVELEDMWKKGYYCPECFGSINPVYEEKLPEELQETDESLIPDLDAEFSIMMGIEERLGYQPYNFKSINKGKSVRLQHKICNTIFTATPSMIYNKCKIFDPYAGEDISVPYCPKCNQIAREEGINYGAVRFIERLHNHFKNGNVEFPYSFDEDDVFRFKDLDDEIVVKCNCCGYKFTAIPGNLFTNDFSSLCPTCHGKPVSNDAAEKNVQDVKNSNEHDKVEIQEMETQVRREQIEKDKVEFEKSQPKEVIETVIEEEPVENTSTEPEVQDNFVEEDLFVDDVDEPISSNDEVSILESEESTVKLEKSFRTLGDNLEEVNESLHDLKEETKESKIEPEFTEDDIQSEEERVDISEPEPTKLEDINLESVQEAEDISKWMYDESDEVHSISEDEESETLDENEEIESEEPVVEESVLGEEPSVETNETATEQKVNEISEDEIISEEVDVESLADEAELDSLYEKQETSTEEPLIQNVNMLGYPEVYEPKVVNQETPDFMNPEMVRNEETAPWIEEPQPTEETEEEIEKSMNEIIEDLELRDDTSVEETHDMIISAPAEEPVEDEYHDEDGIPYGTDDELPEDEEDGSEHPSEDNYLEEESKDTSITSMEPPPYECHFVNDFGMPMSGYDPFEDPHPPVNTQNPVQIDIINQNQCKPNVGLGLFEFVDDDLM